MKKALLTIIIVFTLLSLSLANLSLIDIASVAGVQFVKVGAVVFPTLEPYQKPIATILSPQNGEHLTSSDVELKVQIHLFGLYDQAIERISWLNYSIDSQKLIPIINGTQGWAEMGKVTYTYPNADYRMGFYANVNFTLQSLSDGEHSLFISGNTTWRDSYFLTKINFTTSGLVASPSPSPSPTLAPTTEPTSTIEPTSTPEQPTGFLGTSLPVEYGYAIVAALVIAVVAGLSLVYFKKVKR